MASPHPFLRPKKALGQHFLVAQKAITGIVSETLASPAPRILEIGPGPGVLTEPLLEDGRPLWAVDLDREACTLLGERFASEPHFHLLQGDAIRVPLPNGPPWAVVGNLPYNAATAILTRFLVEGVPWERMVLMFQLEVGQKLLGGPGTKDYGPLSVLAQSSSTMLRLFKLGPGAFAPPPKVDSVVLCFKPKEGLPLAERKPFLAFLHAAFAHRRKTLANNLMAVRAAEQIRQLLEEAGLEPASRAEALPPESLLALFRRAGGIDWAHGNR